MKIQISQQCEIAGQHLAVKYKGKPAIHDVSVDLLFDPYFASLLKHGALKVLKLGESEFLEKHEKLAKGLDPAVVEHVKALFDFELDAEADEDLGDDEGNDLSDDDSEDPPAPPEKGEKTEEEKAAEEAALKKQLEEAAKTELADLNLKPRKSAKDKKRIEELEQQLGG